MRKLVLKDSDSKRADWQVIGGLYPTILNQDIEGIGKTGDTLFSFLSDQMFVCVSAVV